MQRAAATVPKPRRIPGVDRIVLIASGKGGVGKSTVACNLAVGLARKGHAVGLLDTDVHGPSVPRLMGLSAARASVSDSGALLPVTNYGVKCMSLGFLTQPSTTESGQAGEPEMVAWRGLMVMKAVQQLMWRVAWGRLDYLVVDTPPGTGDTHLSLYQQLVLDSAVIVTSPQAVALAAAEKGLLLVKRMGVPVLGVVENMKWLACQKCGHENIVFDDVLSPFRQRHGLDLLASVPISRRIASDSDRGSPNTEHYAGLIAAVEQVNSGNCAVYRDSC